jgi:tetratricopeptide (TPR) repeat protein
MSELDSQIRNFLEQVRLLLVRDPIKGFELWADLYTRLAQAGEYELCDELLQMIKGMELPGYGVGIVRYGEGWMYDRRGQWREAIAAYEAALKAFDEVNLPLRSLALAQIGSLYQDQGDWDRAEEAYNRALAAATDDKGRAWTLNNLGGLWTMREDHQRARQYFEEARAIFHAADDRTNYAATSVGLAGVLREEGLLQESVDHLAEAIVIFRDAGNIKALATAVASLALTYHLANRIPEAIQTYRTALEISISIGDRNNIAKTLANLALISTESGNIEEALGYLEQALAEYQEIGDRHGEELARGHISRLRASAHHHS